MFFEGSRDFIKPFLTLGFLPDTPGQVEAIKKDVLPRYLPIFDKV